MLFELRQYRTLPGQRDNWVRFMEEEVIPFQISKGIVVVASFVGEEEDDLYVWIRRFDSEESAHSSTKQCMNPTTGRTNSRRACHRCSIAAARSSRGSTRRVNPSPAERALPVSCPVRHPPVACADVLATWSIVGDLPGKHRTNNTKSIRTHA